MRKTPIKRRKLAKTCFYPLPPWDRMQKVGRYKCAVGAGRARGTLLNLIQNTDKFARDNVLFRTRTPSKRRIRSPHEHQRRERGKFWCLKRHFAARNIQTDSSLKRVKKHARLTHAKTPYFAHGPRQKGSLEALFPMTCCRSRGSESVKNL